MEQRGRLVAILGMLGSEHDGERAAAAKKAEALRVQLGKSWDDLIVSDGPRRQPPPSYDGPRPQGYDYTPPPPRNAALRSPLANIRDTAHLAVNLNEWERNFVADCVGKIDKGWSLTDAQVAKALEIIKKAHGL